MLYLHISRFSYRSLNKTDNNSNYTVNQFNIQHMHRTMKIMPSITTELLNSLLSKVYKEQQNNNKQTNIKKDI